jgi:hypothetical protein
VVSGEHTPPNLVDEVLHLIDVDPASPTFNTVIDSIPAGLTDGQGNRGSIAVTPDGRFVYHNGFIRTVPSDGRLVVFDVLTRNVTVHLLSTFGLSFSFQGQMYVTPDGQSLLMWGNDDDVLLLDIGTDPANPTVVTTITNDPKPGFVFRVVGNRLFTFNILNNTVQVFNYDRVTPDFSPLGSFAFPGTPGLFAAGMEVTPDGALIYAPIIEDSAVAIVDTGLVLSGSPSALLTKVATGLTPFNLAVRPGTPTPVGVDVSVQIVEELTVIFSSVTAAGATRVAVAGAHPIPLPGGLSPGNRPLFYEVNTTAAFSGTVQVCITYDESQFTSEGSLRVLHQEGAVWVDRTFSIDTANNILCGRVTSLSAFVVAE